MCIVRSKAETCMAGMCPAAVLIAKQMLGNGLCPKAMPSLTGQIHLQHWAQGRLYLIMRLFCDYD